MYRCMSLAGIAPPATLSVVSGFANETRSISWALIDWVTLNFFDNQNDIAQPSSEIIEIATLAAESMAIIPPTPPAANSSFHMQFLGPTVQCSAANSSQLPGFNHYSNALANDSFMTVIKSLFESGNLVWVDGLLPSEIEPLMSIYSAFSPYAGQLGWIYGNISTSSPDEFNNWFVELPPGSVAIWTPSVEAVFGPPPRDEFGDLNQFWINGSIPFVTQQLWVQTADQALVYIMGNASFDVSYEFIDTALTTAEYNVSMFEPLWIPLHGENNQEIPMTVQSPPNYWNSFNSYMAWYLAFSSLLNGNVSTTLNKKPTYSMGMSRFMMIRARFFNLDLAHVRNLCMVM